MVIKSWHKRQSRVFRDSISTATAIFAVVGTAASILGVSLRQVLPEDLPLWISVIIVLAAYVAVILLIRFAKQWHVRNGISLKLCGNDVVVKCGDLFKCDGWKLIPFNEYFDTLVDDIVIAKASLNGIFIENYVDNIGTLREVIATDDDSTLAPPAPTKDSRLRYELGTIKRYGDDYLLLAFTHFNELNEAHLTMADYEQCLMRMWREVNRVYASKPVFVPLLGSGITRFDDFGERSYQDLLRCLVCTLKSSRLNFSAPITVVLTKATLEQVSLYELKEIE